MDFRKGMKVEGVLRMRCLWLTRDNCSACTAEIKVSRVSQSKSSKLLKVAAEFLGRNALDRFPLFLKSIIANNIQHKIV